MILRLAPMFRALLALFAFSFATSRASAAEPPPVSAFISAPDFRNPKLSPNGDTLAVVFRRDFADMVVLLDTATLQPRPGPSISNLRILNYWWKGNDTLLLLLEEVTGESYFRAFNLQTNQTSELRQLNRRAAQIVNPLVSDPDHVLVASATPTGSDLRRYDLVKDKMEVLEKNPGWVFRWLTDRAGQAVAGFGRLDDQWFMLVREKPGADWKRIDLGKRSSPDFWPMAVAPDQHRLIGYDYLTADTARAIYRDPLTGAEEELFHSPEVDPSFNLVWGDDETRVRAIAYETDSPRFHYLEPGDAKLAAEIDRALPNTTNSIVSTSADESRMLIQASSDIVPELYFLLDRKANRLQALGGARDGIVPERLVRSRYITFSARDGQKLSGRIILPSVSAGKPPLIVSAGATLNRRSTLVYQPFMQLLATRGYAVLEVNHRGVQGFGQSFAKAGEMKIATTMSDDLADAVRHVIGQGWVDPKRVAILGQDEGGVLALHALVRNQELYSAWINLETSMDLFAVNTESLAFGLHETSNGELKASELFKLRRYRRDLDPSLQLGFVKVPSFHYYSHSEHERSGYKVSKALKKTNVPFTVVVRALNKEKGDPTVMSIDRFNYQETLRAYTKLIEFLQERLPAGASRTSP